MGGRQAKVGRKRYKSSDAIEADGEISDATDTSCRRMARKTEKHRIDQVCKDIRKVFPTMPKQPEVEMIGSNGRDMVYTRIFVIRDAQES